MVDVAGVPEGEGSGLSARIVDDAASPPPRPRAWTGGRARVALRHFSKRFAEGKDGLSHDELARATQLGSDALAGRRLFYLTRKAIERLPTPPAH